MYFKKKNNIPSLYPKTEREIWLEKHSFDIKMTIFIIGIILTVMLLLTFTSQTYGYLWY